MAEMVFRWRCHVCNYCTVLYGHGVNLLLVTAALKYVFQKNATPSVVSPAPCWVSIEYFIFCICGGQRLVLQPIALPLQLELAISMLELSAILICLLCLMYFGSIFFVCVLGVISGFATLVLLVFIALHLFSFAISGICYCIYFLFDIIWPDVIRSTALQEPPGASW